MNRILILALILAFPGLSHAQLSVEEAQARLQAKQAERGATKPATRPAETDEVRELRQVLAQLREENATLRKELAEAKKPEKPVATKPADKKKSKLAEGQFRVQGQDVDAAAVAREQAFNEQLVGMTLEEATDKIRELKMGDGKTYLVRAYGDTKLYRLSADPTYLVTVGPEGIIRAFQIEK